MPGPITLSVPSYLPGLISARPPGNSLLAALSARTGPAAAPSASAAEQASSGVPQVMDAELRTKRDIAQFTLALGSANTPAQLLANPVALRVLLIAHGLADQVGNSGLATRALLSNPARTNSLLNQLKDPRWLAVNQRYSFATQGLAVLRNADTGAALARCYGEALGAAGLDPAPPGASNAVTFAREITPPDTE